MMVMLGLWRGKEGTRTVFGFAIDKFRWCLNGGDWHKYDLQSVHPLFVYVLKQRAISRREVNYKLSVD